MTDHKFIETKRGASQSLATAEESVAVAYSLLISKSVEDSIPYTIYIELMRAVDNAGKGLKICRAILDKDSVIDASGIHD